MGAKSTKKRPVPSTTLGGVYCPSSRVQGLGSCMHLPDQAVRLKCKCCGHNITSAWFFRHPKSGERSVLVPCNGHVGCSQLPRVPGKKRNVIAGKHAQFMAVDGSSVKADNVSYIEYCRHEKLRRCCPECTDYRLCQHGKVLSECFRCRRERRAQRLSGNTESQT